MKDDLNKKLKLEKYLIIVFIIVLSVILILYSKNAGIEDKDTITALITLIGAGAVFIQIKQSTNIARAEFVMGLQETYSSSKGFSNLFMLCWEEYLIAKRAKVLLKEGEDLTLVENYLEDREGREVLLNYLTFFESIYIMNNQGNLDFDLLDELFGRRFFAVVTNKAVQEHDLVPNKDYYENVYKLYADWKQYREKKVDAELKRVESFITQIVKKSSSQEKFPREELKRKIVEKDLDIEEGDLNVIQQAWENAGNLSCKEKKEKLMTYIEDLLKSKNFLEFKDKNKDNDKLPNKALE